MPAGFSRVAGIGVDLLSVARIKRVYDRHSESFVKRILGQCEIEKFRRRHERDQARGMRFLASRFAAKEAFSKAIGTGMHSPMTWSRVQILNGPGGKPYVRLDGPLAQWYATRFGAAHVSLSDENDTVVAFVVVEALCEGPNC